jgi:hypothetical protein
VSQNRIEIPTLGDKLSDFKKLFSIAFDVQLLPDNIVFDFSHCQCSLKEYRHNFPKERINVTAELPAVWGQVKSMASVISVNIDENIVNEFLKRFKNEKVDGYDIFMLECMQKHEIRNIITDDSDFATVSGIQVFTANRGMLAAARKQKK